MKIVLTKIAALAAMVWLLPARALAALGGLEPTANAIGYEKKDSDIFWFIGTGIGMILSFVGVLFLGLMMAGGFIWMTSAGNEDKVTQAKKMIVAAVIGLIIVAAAYTISAYVGANLNINEGT